MAKENENIPWQQAIDIVNYTSRNLFLTGKAGTGKTTFLKHIKKYCAKKKVILAPTGVAAINAGGTTIHSFFLIPPATYLPTYESYGEDGGTVLSFTHVLQHHVKDGNSPRVELVRELDLLVIDEVSMLRADLLDMIDLILKKIRKSTLPFGGVQMLFIGDLFQLPPVVKQEEEALLNKHYASPFFFDALALKNNQPLYIELNKVYRQQDDAFIQCLNNIRHNENVDFSLQKINQKYIPHFTPSKEENYITLASHNYIADAINEKALNALEKPSFVFDAVVEGIFSSRNYPVEERLVLKEGAQIMFVRNDQGEHKRFFNGKIGVIETLTSDEITVRFEDESTLFSLQKEAWKNIRYVYNKKKNVIEEEVIGSFSQYPIRLAWAITIHKSQGLTFDKAIIHAGGSFAAGQVYVALSRMRSLQGMVLATPIFARSIISDNRVVAYMQNQLAQTVTAEILLQEKMIFLLGYIKSAFDISEIEQLCYDFLNGKLSLFIENINVLQKGNELRAGIKAIKIESKKIIAQIDSIITVAMQTKAYHLLQERVLAGKKWMLENIKHRIELPFEVYSQQVLVTKISKKNKQQIDYINKCIQQQYDKMQKAEQVIKILQENASFSTVLEAIEEPVLVEKEVPQKKKSPEKRDFQRETLRFFKEVSKDIDIIAAERGLATSTILGHLLSFLPTREVEITDLLPEVRWSEMQEFLQENHLLDWKTFMEKGDGLFTKTELIVAYKYCQWQNSLQPTAHD